MHARTQTEKAALKCNLCTHTHHTIPCVCLDCFPIFYDTLITTLWNVCVDEPSDPYKYLLCVSVLRHTGDEILTLMKIILKNMCTLYSKIMCVGILLCMHSLGGSSCQFTATGVICVCANVVLLLLLHIDCMLWMCWCRSSYSRVFSVFLLHAMLKTIFPIDRSKLSRTFS